MESNCRIVHALISANKLRSLKFEKYGKKEAAYRKLWENLNSRRQGFLNTVGFLSHEEDRRYIKKHIDHLTELMHKVSGHFTIDS